jgi:hypothetical protein
MNKTKKIKTKKHSKKNINVPYSSVIKKLNTTIDWKNADGQKIFFVHIGKAGGTAVDHELARYKLGFFHIHCEKPPYHSNYKYIISIRDPIAQTISSFNWRYGILIDKIMDSSWKAYSPDFLKEIQVLKKYKTINTIAELLYDVDDKPVKKVHNELREIYHVKYGTSYYLQELLEHLNPKQIIAIIEQEHLEEDLKKYLDITISPTNSGKSTSSSKHGYDVHLSVQGFKNLKKFLKTDYELVNKLKKIYSHNI